MQVSLIQMIKLFCQTSKIKMIKKLIQMRIYIQTVSFYCIFSVYSYIK